MKGKIRFEKKDLKYGLAGAFLVYLGFIIFEHLLQWTGEDPSLFISLYAGGLVIIGIMAQRK